VEALAPLRESPARAATFFDIDGTLAPIVDQPVNAVVPERTRQLLVSLARRYGAVACVSGRRASEARAMVGVGTISYLGSHGTELLRAGAAEPILDPGLEDWRSRMSDFGRQADTPDLRRRRVRLEDKGVILAFHWRGAPDQEAARAAIDAVAAKAESAGLRTHWGRKVLEVRPPVRIDKGAGVRSFLEGLDVDSALYVGDDATDLDAFRMLDQLVAEGHLAHALKVGVRSDEGPEAIVGDADVDVDGTRGVLELLELLASE
jgi:trehalose 6-phosphate phosphatase